MRVIFGSFSAITVLGGGVEVQMRALARELGRLGIEVELFDPWKRYGLKDYSYFHLFGSHVGTYHLGRSMHGLGIRLIVTPVFYSRHNPARVATAVGIAGKVRQRGGFWTEHMFCKELCDMAELVLPDTRDEMEMLARGFGVPASKMHELPNGVEERFANATPDLFVKEHGLKDFVLYVGHIGPARKNVFPMLKAVKALGLPTVLIGPVSETGYANQCMKLVAETPNIKVIPGLAPDSPVLESAYAACDTFVLPSLYETPGLAALEAGLAGAKVCITRYGGTREYFDEHATYLEPGSEESIVNSIKQARERKKDSALRDRIRANYLWPKAGEILASIYKTAAQT
ncbi:glycosyltransferase family 4 protein [candidate division WOR-3 bacterium]|uniref:Glycosyltransferase family 4 protein n=1 Tax=candidate division WOR-3 bacterium TaxID=2052148 RepID=A0A938BQI1_UNCW3|nr:glycosyltransferase family 4 protein [candidate division WOR-3 bacterium]